MEQTTFLQHYRIRVGGDGSPYELDRSGAPGYQAVDERSGEPVSLRLIAADSIDPAVWNQFEEQAAAAQKLRHVNIARVLDFGRESDDFVYVSEHLPGETVAAWVGTHGPMPIDVALRVAEQIVSVLSSASFHKLPLPSIEPSDIIVVPGQTPEGTWPLVKITNFGLPPLRARTEVEASNSQSSESAVLPEQAGPAQELAPVTNDIGSEISSLGATLYFVLTGVTVSAQTRQAPPKLSRFPKPLRTLFAQLCHPHTDKRPKDLIVVAEMIRQCLLKIERRRQFADRYGIPYRRTLPRTVAIPSARLLRGALVVGALLLIAVLLAPVVLPKTIGRIMHGSRETKDLGVLVGVPESSSTTASQNVSSTTGASSVTSQPTAALVAQAPRTAQTSKAANAIASSQEENRSAPSPNEPPVTAASESNSPPAESPDRQARTVSGKTSNDQPQTPIADTSARSAGASSQSAPGEETKSRAQINTGTQPSTASGSNSRSKNKTVSSRRARRNPDASEDWPQRRSASVRARVVGITSDGRLILRLPSGRTGIVAPDSTEDESRPPRHRRVYREPQGEFGPPPQFGPDFPDD